jgi:branched-chain amino acid transport system permease protein
MSQFITFVVLGFASGAIYLGISVGLVTVYLSSGILNFAQAAIAMWGCYVFAVLRTSGKLVFPVGTVSLGSSVGSAAALIIALVTTVILGEIIHLLIFRPLRRASVMAQIVASVAVLITLVGLATVRFGTNTMQVPSMLPSHTYNVGGAHIGLGYIVIAVIAILVACAVGAYFRWTTPGIATRAASSNQDALGLMGYSPTVLDSSAWVIASLASTLMVILGAPTISINTAVAYLVVPALAILLVARMRSLVVIAIASLVLGSVQSLITLYSGKSWWPGWGRSGLQDALPFLVAIIVLFILGDRIGTRDVTSGAGLPKVHLPRRPILTIIVVGAVALIGLLVTTGPTRFGVMTSIITMVLILSYTIITGYLGQVSLAQIAFAGASGFLLSKATVNWGIGFPWALLISALFATAIGILIGVAALRFRGVQLAIVTLAAAVAVQAFVFDNAYFTSVQGNLVGNPQLFGINLAIEGKHNVARLQFGFMVFVILLLCVAGLLRWARGRTGRAWLAVRSNERAAASSGINLATTKISGFALSAFLAGVSGALVGYSQGQLSTGSFEVDAGILLFATAFLGGITSIGGAAVAGAIAPLGFVYVLLNNHINFGKWYSLIAGIGLILTVINNPDGIAGKTAEQFQDLRARFGPKTGKKAEVQPAAPVGAPAADVSGAQAVGRGA